MLPAATLADISASRAAGDTGRSHGGTGVSTTWRSDGIFAQVYDDEYVGILGEGTNRQVAQVEAVLRV